MPQQRCIVRTRNVTAYTRNQERPGPASTCFVSGQQRVSATARARSRAKADRLLLGIGLPAPPLAETLQVGPPRTALTAAEVDDGPARNSNPSVGANTRTIALAVSAVEIKR